MFYFFHSIINATNLSKILLDKFVVVCWDIFQKNKRKYNGYILLVSSWGGRRPIRPKAYSFSCYDKVPIKLLGDENSTVLFRCRREDT